MTQFSPQRWTASVLRQLRVLVLSLPLLLTTSGSTCYAQHGIDKESRSWRLDGRRPFPLEHSLLFEPRPGTISCEARPSAIPRAQDGPEGMSSHPKALWPQVSRLGVASLTTRWQPSPEALGSSVLPDSLGPPPASSSFPIFLAFLHKGWR